MSNENNMQVSTDSKKKMNPVVFWPPIIILVGFVIAGAVATEQVGGFMTAMLYGMVDKFGWYINLLSLVLLIMSVIFIVRKYGDIKIGGKECETSLYNPSMVRHDNLRWDWNRTSFLGYGRTDLSFCNAAGRSRRRSVFQRCGNLCSFPGYVGLVFCTIRDLYSPSYYLGRFGEQQKNAVVL